MRTTRIALILSCGLLVLTSISSMVYAMNRMEVAESKAKVVEISTRAARIRQYEFLRGVYAFCLATYNDPYNCNRAVKIAVDLGIPSDPTYSLDFEPPQ